MSEFKVGDRVRVSNRFMGARVWVGKTGRIVRSSGIYDIADLVVLVDDPGKNNEELCVYSDEIDRTTTRLYVAGPMRNLPYFNFPEFDKAAAALRDAGYDVFSPAEHDREVYGAEFEKAYPTGKEDGDFDLRAALKADTTYICLQADGIALLPGWGKSSGARAEKALAQALGLPCKSVDEWLHGADIDAPVPFELTAKSGEVRVTSATGGEKGQKPAQLGAVDPLALMTVAEVAGFGAGKYARYNYTNGYDWSLSYDALQRHINAFWAGEDNDPESGLPHAAHAAWHCLTLLTFLRFGVGTDDRFPLRKAN